MPPRRFLRALTLGAIALVAIAAARPRAAESRRCTMQFIDYNPQIPFVLLGHLSGRTAVDSLSLNGAPENAHARMGRRDTSSILAWEWLIDALPDTVRRKFKSVISKAHGAIWVVPWIRGSDCALSPWHWDRRPRETMGILFLGVRPQDKWIRGAPTFDMLYGMPSPSPVYSRGGDREDEHPAEYELRTYIKVYKRSVSRRTPSSDSALIRWALAHRDSASTRPLRAFFYELFRDASWERLHAHGVAPHAGVWRFEMITALGDTTVRWARIARSIEVPEWPDTYPAAPPSRTFAFDTNPPPVRYNAEIAFAAERDSLPSASTPWPPHAAGFTAETWILPATRDSTYGYRSWLSMAVWSSPAHLQVYALLDSMMTRPNIGPDRPRLPTQRIRGSADTLSGTIVSGSVVSIDNKRQWRDTVVARWRGVRVSP